MFVPYFIFLKTPERSHALVCSLPAEYHPTTAPGRDNAAACTLLTPSEGSLSPAPWYVTQLQNLVGVNWCRGELFPGKQTEMEISAQEV